MADIQETALGAGTRVLSRALAKRWSRRSLIGRAGRGAVVMAMAGAGAATLLADPSEAHSSTTCGSCTGTCCSSDSVRCGSLPGWMQNSCPTNAFNCGYWDVNDSSCASGIRRQVDCCADCHNGADCTCINGNPSCCRHKSHSNQQGTCGDHIKCRRHLCLAA